jgi:Passenger-associated-transport-repeat
MKFPRIPLFHSLALSLLAASSAHAANATWTGVSNGTWLTAGNWSAATPSTGDTVTFNNAGNGNTLISINAITVGNIVFDTANTAAYILGTGAAGSQSFALTSVSDGGTITVNSTVTNQQSFNASVVLGASSVTAAYSFTNNSATVGHLLTIAGNVSSGLGNPNGQTKTLTVGGTANGVISGEISGNGSGTGQNKTATVALTKTGTGVWTLSGNNTYAGITTVTTGRLLANNATSSTGTGAVSVGASGILGGTGTVAPTGINGINVSGVLAPGDSVGTGNLNLNLGGTTGIVTMANSSAGFEYQLGLAGVNINSFGTSDVLTLTGAAAGDFAFSGNTINFQGTGGVGYYKLFDTSFNATTWTGLTVGGTGLITSGLSVSNLASGLTGNLIMGGNSLGGTAGDIYLQVVPEPTAALLGGIGALFLLRRRRVA